MTITALHTDGATGGGAAGTATSGSWTSTTGSTIIVVGHMFSGGSSPGALANGDCTDSKSNTYTLAPNSGIYTGTDSPGIAVYYNIGGTRGASHTVTINPVNESGDTINIAVLEIDGSNVVFHSGSAQHASDGTSPLAVTAAAALPSNAIAIVGATVDTGGTNAFGDPAGYTPIRAEADGANSLVSYAAYKIGESGTPTVSITNADTISAARETFVVFSDDGASGSSGTVAVTLADYTSTASGTIAGPLGIIYVKEVGFVTDTSAGTTSAITVASGGVPVGDTIVIYGACDNTGTSGAATTIAVADNSTQSGSANTYSLQSPQAIADPGAASAGQQGFLLVCNVTRSLLAGDTITVTYGNSTTAKAINAQQFTGVNQTTPVLASSYNHQDNQTGQAVSVATGVSPTRNGQVVCALVAVEGGTADAFTQDTDTTDGSWVTLTRRGSGTTTSGSTLNSVFKYIQNTGTPSAQTYNGTTMLGTSRDHAAAILILDIPPTSGTSAQTLAAYAPAVTATESMTATSAQTLANFTSAASGTAAQGNSGTVAVTLDNFTSTATGSVSPVGTVAVTLAAFTSAATGTETITGTVAVTLAAFTSTASGVAATNLTGTVAVTLGDFAGHGANITALFVDTASADGHLLLDQNGDPLLVCGNSPQNWVPNMLLSDFEDFFSDQETRGFNSCQMHLVYNFEADAESGVTPFQTNSTLNVGTHTAYWDTIDAILGLAERYGFTVWGTVLDDITCGSTVASVSDANCFAFGQFLGARYKDTPNIVWVVGNDYSSGDWGRDSKYENIIDGIRDQGDTHLMTLWLDIESSDNNTNWDSRNDIVLCYRYDWPPYYQTGDVYQLTRTGFPKPVFWGEGTYYGEKNATTTPPLSTDLELRKLAWWGITWGGLGGHFFGTHEVWSAGDWQSELTANIYDQLALIPPLWAGMRDRATLAPDISHAFQTGGRGTFEGGSAPELDSDNYATATYANGGHAAIVYFPTSRGSITFDTTKLSGTVTAYWFDPTSGDTTVESTPAAPTHPGTNDAGDADWVLVFESSDNLTGTVAQTLANFTSAVTAVEKMTATSAQTLANFTSAASGTSVISGTSAQTLADFMSTATGTSVISGMSAQTLADFTGAATGSETITGTEASTLAAFTSTATGVVANPVTGTVAQTLADYTGTASGTESMLATAAVTLADFASAASGLVAAQVTGSVAVALADFFSTADGSSTEGNDVSGTVAVTLANYTGAASGTETITGSAAITITLATSTAVALEIFTGVGAVGLVAASGSATGTESFIAASAQTLANFTGAATGTENTVGTAGSILSISTCSATGAVTNPVTGTSAQTLQDFTGAATGSSLVDLTGTVAITLQNFVCFASDLLASLPASPTDQHFILYDNLDDDVRVNVTR